MKLDNAEEPFPIINNWMRSRSIIEFIGLWEKLNNPDFKRLKQEENNCQNLKWNLQDIFMHPLSFSHTSKGISTDFNFKLGYKVSSILSLTLGGTYASTKVYKGTDRAYLVTNTQVSTQFNGAKNNRYSSMIGILITL